MTKKYTQRYVDSLQSDAFRTIASACKLPYTLIVLLLTIASPIATYSRTGTLRRPDAEHHSVAYSSHAPPNTLPGENLSKIAIKINLESGELPLHDLSRINFSKLYTVEHNIKLKKVGKIHPDFLAWAFAYCKESCGISFD